MKNEESIVHKYQFTIHNSQFSIHNSQFSIHNSQFTILSSIFIHQSSFINLQSSIFIPQSSILSILHSSEQLSAPWHEDNNLQKSYENLTKNCTGICTGSPFLLVFWRFLFVIKERCWVVTIYIGIVWDV